MKKKENIICKIFGHSWSYKDYRNRMQPDGKKYPYKMSRKCIRCSKKEISTEYAEADRKKLFVVSQQ